MHQTAERGTGAAVPSRVAAPVHRVYQEICCFAHMAWLLTPSLLSNKFKLFLCALGYVVHLYKSLTQDVADAKKGPKDGYTNSWREKNTSGC